MRSNVLTLSADALEQRLQLLATPGLADLGGLATLAAVADTLSQSVYADRLVRALAGEGEPLSDQAVDIIDRILAQNPHPFVVAATAQVLLDAPLGSQQQRLLQRRLLQRATVRDTPIACLMASECLAGGFLLADLPGASRPAALAALDEITAGDDPILVRRAALLAGLAWLWGRSSDLEDLLVRLSQNNEAGEQALFELAFIALDRALAAETSATMLQGLEVAARKFSAAADAGPELVEAAALSQVLLATTKFCSDSQDGLEPMLAQAVDAAATRHRELDRQALRSWLRPRLDVEAAWWSLASSLKGLSLQLAQPSWLRAVPVLEQIARLRRAMVPLASPGGDVLRRSITDTLALSFLRQEGLRSHLTAWRDDKSTSEADRSEASALLEAIAELSSVRSAPEGASAAPSTAQEQQLAGLISLSAPLGFTGALERAYLAMDGAVDGHVDYVGEMRSDVGALITYLTLFLGHCLDMTPAMAKGGFEFLFADGRAKPLEEELQRACWHFLRLQAHGFPHHQIIRELNDVGGGRADIAIVRPQHRLVIEIKRELADASREGISKYLGQTAAYELTGPRIGFLVVLDLVSQRGWPLTLEDNCWVEQVQAPNDTVPRTVCVWRIPGARRTPSAITTPVQ